MQVILVCDSTPTIHRPCICAGSSLHRAALAVAWTVLHCIKALHDFGTDSCRYAVSRPDFTTSEFPGLMDSAACAVVPNSPIQTLLSPHRQLRLSTNNLCHIMLCIAQLQAVCHRYNKRPKFDWLISHQLHRLLAATNPCSPSGPRETVVCYVV